MANKKAAALLTTILIVAAITLSIALSVNLRSIGGMLTGMGQSHSDKARAIAEACLDEALLQLDRNYDNYNGGNLTLSGGDCNISIDKSGPNPILTISGQFKQFTKKITVEFDLTNKVILNWQEI